jgi:hypothetical protein
MPDSFYEHEFITRLCERFITHLFACPEYPPAATHSQANLTDSITHPYHYTRHHTRRFETGKNIFNNIDRDPVSDTSSRTATSTPSLFLPAQKVTSAIDPSLPPLHAPQLEARNSVFNNVGQNQYNQSVVINNLTLGREDLYPPTRHNANLSQNHHFPSHVQVATNTTTFTTTNIAAAALYWNINLGTLASLVSLTVKITSFRYSFFSNTQPD